MLHQLGDPVVVQAGTHAQLTGADCERRHRPWLPAQVQCGPKQFVDHLFEGLALPAGFGFHVGSNILI